MSQERRVSIPALKTRKASWMRCHLTELGKARGNVPTGEKRAFGVVGAVGLSGDGQGMFFLSKR